MATKTLGILKRMVRLYIVFIFPSNAKEKAVIEVIRNRLFDWNNLIFPEDKSNGIDLNKANTALDFVANNICNNLDTLNLVKKMWEQTLIYARYGAKAREE